MAKLCAYCGAKSALTREHIWPSGFLKRGQFDIKFSARANKTFQGDMTVSDVCAGCNNGVLSILDAHACELYDRRFSKRVEDSDSVTFTYDYAVFIRWLLKISYNSARTTGWDEDLLASYRDVIRCQYPCSPAFVVVFVATVSPLKIRNPSSGQTKKIYPTVARCGPLRIPSLDVESNVMLRCIMINAFYFTILISRTPTLDRSKISSLLRSIPGKPLDLSGRMRLGPPSIPASEALDGINKWPDLLRQ